MTTSKAKKKPDKWNIYNYCVSFIDLLGQKDALQGQGLMPIFNSDEDRQEFFDTFKGSVGSILKLQEDAEEMLEVTHRERPDSPFHENLSHEQQQIWDQMKRTRVTSQRWSDGLVSFTSLGDKEIKCPLNGVFDILALSGSLCFMGLASGRPIRGGIDIAWGVELRPGELYGAAVAQAYELENIHAQYPRIVVGQRVLHFLYAHIKNQDQDVFSANNRELAKLCLDMLVKDVDGLCFLHYLGEGFRLAVSHQYHNQLYNEAHKYIIDQLKIHRNSNNTKLAFRYSYLLLYFDNHPPSEEDQQDIE